MRPTSLQTFALAVGLSVGCSGSEVDAPDAYNPTGTGGSSASSSGTGDTATNGSTSSSGTPTSITATIGSSTTASSSTTVGSTTGANTTGANTTGANTTGANTTGANTTGANTTGANTTGANTTGAATTDGGAGGTTSAGPTTDGGSTTGGNPTDPPDCNAQMPGGGQQQSGNGTGGEGNLAWEIWSNTGQGQLTIFDTPAFIASWNNAGGYLGRMGFEWNRFGDTPVPHDQQGTITAQFVSRRTGTAGNYSYVGMYGWTTNPCVEWYVVDDSYGNMPINPGNTTNMGEVEIDGGTYIMYLRPTTGTGGDRCGGISNWNQYYSVRTSARDCGVISLTEHFNAWQSLGLDMTGELLEAKIIAEVGGGVGSVEFPVANVTVQ